MGYQEFQILVVFQRSRTLADRAQLIFRDIFAHLTTRCSGNREPERSWFCHGRHKPAYDKIPSVAKTSQVEHLVLLPAINAKAGGAENLSPHLTISNTPSMRPLLPNSSPRCAFVEDTVPVVSTAPHSAPSTQQPHSHLA